MALFVTRSTRVADTVGPTAPTITASAASTSTITINRTVLATDTSGIAFYETQRSPAGANNWTTFDSSNNNPITASGLSAGVAYDFRQRAVDTLSNTGTYSTIVQASTQQSGGAGQVGQVGPYSALNLGTHPVYSVDMALNDYLFFTTQNSQVGTGTSTHNSTGWWDNSAYTRMTPPTTDGYERGVGLFDLYRNATVAIQDFNLRFETRMGPQMGSLWDGCKYAFIHCRRTLTPGNRDDRPIFYAREINSSNNPAWNRANTTTFAPGQGTVQGYGTPIYTELSSNEPDFAGQNGASTNPDWLQQFYWVSDNDTGTFNGKPMFSPSEFMTIEFRIITASTAAYPRGLIAFRLYRRNGVVYERGIPYNWDTNVPLGGYVTEVQQFGCGQYNTAPTANANLWFDVGGYITVARNLSGWLGPRNGFVTG